MYTHESRDQAPLVIKEVNGIKVALWPILMDLMELSKVFPKKTITAIFQTSNEDKMKAEIERAEKEADITIIMPQMGVSIAWNQLKNKKALYHKMIDWELILSLEGTLT